MISSPPVTLAEFLELPETEPASEFVDGKILQKPVPQGQHSRVQQKLTAAINSATEDARTALALPELRCSFGGRSIVPDIAVFTWDRLPTDADGAIANQFSAHPDWAIEILSPDPSATRVTANLLHCLNHGARLGWLIDPKEKLILVYAPDQQPSVWEQGSDRLPTPEFAAALQLIPAQLFGWLQIR